MKIFTEKSVYVQMSDINYISNDRSIILPEFVVQEIYGKSYGLKLIDRVKEDRFIRFTDPRSIQWFLDDDMILDYNEVRGLSKSGVLGLIDDLDSDLEDIGARAIELLLNFENIDFEEKTKRTDGIDLSLDDKELRKKSLYAYYNHLTWRKRIRFPKEVKEKRLRMPRLRLTFGKKKKNYNITK
ncbi:MAG: hypothetical protein IKP98_03385 [Bacilli bacterium]|nr:hypothetical protein [Bacilli bacterium]